MNYLINPWLIYLIDKANTMFALAMVVVIVSTVVLIGTIIAEDDCRYNDELYKKVKSFRKTSIITLIISLCFMFACPSSETVTKMVVASYVTEDNVGKAKEEITEIIDYICDKVNEVNE